jgi:hypothetical protein
LLGCVSQRIAAAEVGRRAVRFRTARGTLCSSRQRSGGKSLIQFEGKGENMNTRASVSVNTGLASASLAGGAGLCGRGCGPKKNPVESRLLVRKQGGRTFPHHQEGG